MDLNEEIAANITRSIIANFLRNHKQQTVTECRKLFLPAHLVKPSFKTVVSAEFVQVTFNVDSLIPCSIHIWVGVSLTSINKLYHRGAELFNRPETDNNDVELTSFRSSTVNFKSMLELTPVPLQAGSSQSVTIDVPIAVAERALLAANDHIFIVTHIVGQHPQDIAELSMIETTGKYDFAKDPNALVGLEFVKKELAEHRQPLLVNDQGISFKIKNKATVLALLPTFGLWEDEDSTDCSICMTDPKNIIFMPCRHICVCSECMKQLDKCPICRAEVKSHAMFVSKTPPKEDKQDGPMRASFVINE